MSRDGKDKFYRSLKIDKETNDILKWYRSNRRELENEKTPQKKKESK